MNWIKILGNRILLGIRLLYTESTDLGYYLFIHIYKFVVILDLDYDVMV